MNSIFRIYESLLGKTSDKVQKASLVSVAIAGNEPDSDLRMFFRQPQTNMYEPFEVKGKSLILHPYNKIYLTGDEGKLTDIIGNKFDRLIIEGGLYCMDAFDIGKCLYPVVDAESFTLDYNCVVENVELTAVSYNNRSFPIIHIDGNTVKNSTLEIDYSKVGESFGYIRSIGVPTFINVKSDTIPAIRIEADPYGDSIMAFDCWDKIFEFGYKLGYRTSELDKFKFTTIKSMDDIFKLCRSKQFKVREYDQFPYKLKKGVKLSDIIDISKFKNLKQVVFTNHVSKMFQITFEKVDMCSDKMSIVTKWPTSILIQQRKEYIFGRPDLMLKDVPVTADGWRVLINGD